MEEFTSNPDFRVKNLEIDNLRAQLAALDEQEINSNSAQKIAIDKQREELNKKLFELEQ